MAASGRDIPITLSGKETVSPAAKKAAGAVEDLGDELRDTAKDADKLDGEIEGLNRSLAGLAAAYAAAGSAGERADIFKAIRVDQRKLREKMNVRKLMSDIGKDGAEGFSVSFVQKIGPLLARAPLSPHMLAAVGPAVPLIAAAVSTGITGGIAGGAIAAGVKIAAQDPAVKSAARDMSDEIGVILQGAARPFVPATIAAMGDIRQAVRDIEDELSDVFGDSAGYLAPLTQGLTGFAKNLAPGVRDAVHNAAPLIDLAREHGPKLGQGLGDAFRELSEAAAASRSTIDLMLTAVEKGSKLINSDLFEVLGTTPVRRELENLLAGTDEMDKKLKAMKVTTTDVDANFLRFGQTLESITAASKAYIEANRTIAEQNLTAAEATLRYKDAVSEAKDATDRKTKVSREEDQALINLARSSNTLIASLDAQGASAGTLAKKHEAARTALINAAVKMGYTKDEAAKLADSYLAVPTFVNTRFDAETGTATDNVRKLRELIAQIRSKRVVITVDYKGNQSTRSEGRNVPIGDSIGGRAAGGPVMAGQPYIVGEHRPEVFVPNQNGTIVPSVGQYQQSIKSSPTVVNNYYLNFSGPVGSQMELRTWFVRTLDEVKRRGRS